MEFVYSFVASGTGSRAVILAEYSESTGEFIENSAVTLQDLRTHVNQNFSYKSEGYIYAYSFKGGFTYCVVAVDNVEKQVTTAYLERVFGEFVNKYGKGEEVAVAANSLNEDFAPILKEQMRYHVDHPQENNIVPVTNVKHKGVMMENVVKGLDDIFYTFMARDKKVLADNELKHDSKQMAHQFLQLLPVSPNNTFIFTYGEYVFTFLVEDDMTYGVVSKEHVQEALVRALLHKMLADAKEVSSPSAFISKLDQNLKSCNSDPSRFMSKLKLKKEDFPAIKLENVDKRLKAKVVKLKHDLLAKDEGRLKEIEFARKKISDIEQSWKLMKDYMETNCFHLDEATEGLNIVYEEIEGRVDTERKVTENTKVGKVPYRHWKDEEIEYMNVLLQKEYEKMVPGEKSKLGRGKKTEDGEGCNIEMAKTFRLKFGEPSMDQCKNYITKKKKEYKQKIDAEAKEAKEKAEQAAAANNKASTSTSCDTTIYVEAKAAKEKAATKKKAAVAKNKASTSTNCDPKD